MYFRQFWNDPRLEFARRPGLEKISLTGEDSYPYWIPDTFFPNEKYVRTHKELIPNTLMTISHDGDVMLSKR